MLKISYVLAGFPPQTVILTDYRLKSDQGRPCPCRVTGAPPLEVLQVCLAYSHLRVGRDVELCEEDRVKYFMELTVEREKQKWT